MPKFFYGLPAIVLMAFMSFPAMAAESGILNLEMTSSAYAITAIFVFVSAYVLVMVEEVTHLRKSKPVLLAAGIIWLLVGLAVGQTDYDTHVTQGAFRHVFLEFAELFMFLLVAMTFINTMTERNVFEYLRSWLVARNFSFRKVFWITGILSFFISPIADNLTTALLMCAVVMAVGVGHTKFVALACINIVVAANAGGAFSPFGDITTLMVWQKGVIDFFGFFQIFIPSVVNYIVPAAIMHFAIPDEQPEAMNESVSIKKGGIPVIFLFLGTIAFTVSGHQFFHIPPTFGMMTGLGVLGFYSFFLKYSGEIFANGKKFDIFEMVGGAEWDTLLFFYGVLMCVGGLATFGYLTLASEFMYGDLGATNANILVGILSALVDNIPVMFAVLTMFPAMDEGQWLLATLTAGVGGSMLSIGSAAGVALMGQARGMYTFFSHLKWTWAIAIGYAASIVTHLYVNKHLFDNVALTLK
ncbi:Citrate transporter [alpha proteobacterium IMCC14465]|uniref:Citrate transporter n=1 Tax=alpha proteobacterium IMCC14465 TaxID=1220535 RepID=J9A5X3_9PROT|nr:Citrate transporter [alpha proteobacterium IMCC14465]